MPLKQLCCRERRTLLRVTAPVCHCRAPAAWLQSGFCPGNMTRLWMLRAAVVGGIGLLTYLPPLPAVAAASCLIITTVLCQLHSIATSSPSSLEPRPGPTWKVMAAYGLVYFSKLVRPRAAQLKDLAWLEGRHKEGSTDESFNDSFYFWGSSQPPDVMCVTTRLGFHGIGAAQVTPWLVFEVAGRSFALTEEFMEAAVPDADGIAASDESGNRIAYQCIVPMKQWKIVYSGPVRCLTDGTDGYWAEVELLATLMSPAFYYQRDWDQLTVAKAMSAMPWSIGFFRKLSSEHQEHYEAGSTVSGSITVTRDGVPVESVGECAMQGFRDHSFGKRDWTFMVRYLWFGTITFEKPLRVDGHEYTHLTGTAVHYGTSFKHMVAGGLMGPSKEQPILPITGTTHMAEIASQWYYEPECSAGQGLGHMVPDLLKLQIGLKGHSGHIDMTVTRDSWKHGFLMQNDMFEVHEGSAIYSLTFGDQTVAGFGLLEFGGVVNARPAH